MQWLDLTLKTPEENLAFDEALIDYCESHPPLEVLRFWQSSRHFVVVGYSNRVRREANLKVCREEDVPVLRRSSGGGTVLQGPGCLNYALVLQHTRRPELHSIRATNHFVLSRHQQALESCLKQPIEFRGDTDLAINGRKFSGNAQRRRKNYLLYHGTFLLDLDFSKIEKLLSHPSREPDYRQGRPHRQFLMNLKVPAPSIQSALCKIWNARPMMTEPPLERCRELLDSKFRRRAWNFKY